MKLEDLTTEQQEKISEFGLNTWYVLELLDEYNSNPDSVSDNWKDLFKNLNLASNGKNKKGELKQHQSTSSASNQNIVSMPLPAEGEEAAVIRGVGAKVIENMNSKVLEENRRIINEHLKKKNGGKISFTHIIGWAIVKGIDFVPVMNNAFTVINNEPNLIRKKDVNLGLAVDLEKKDGSRSLIVPNIKKANLLNFRKYFEAYNDIINRSRSNKIEVSDFQGTTVTLTNPGTISGRNK